MAKDISFKDFSNFLSNDVIPSVTNSLEKTVKLCCKKVSDDIQYNMAHTPLDMSKTYYSNNKTKAHHPSFPGNPPAPDSGHLRDSIRYEIENTGNTVYGIVGSTLKDPDYAVWMEYGTSDGRVAHRPWLRPAMISNNEFIRTSIAKAVARGLRGAGK